jgi:CHAD domain
MLTPVEDFWLRWHAEHSSDELAGRARLVLEAEAGGSPGQVAASLGLTPQAAEGVLAKFEHDRLATFPRATVRLDQLIRLDTADNHLRRQHLARQAKRLFNDTQPLHHMPRKALQLLEAAALLPPVTYVAPGGALAQQPLHMLDGAVLADLGPTEQAIISCVLHCQHKGFRADREAAFKPLRPAAQSQVRYLAALLQVAAQLDNSGTQSTVLKGAELQGEAVVLRLMGPKAKTDGAFACRKAWLWPPVFHSDLKYEIGPRAKASAANPAAAGSNRDEPAGAVFGRQLAAALRKWEPGQPGAAATDLLTFSDPLAGVGQALAALGAFASILKRRPVKELKRRLRALYGLLAAVVDQQYALSDLDAYMSGRPPAATAELQPLREAWERTGRQQQNAMRALLASDDTARLHASLTQMAHTPPVRRRKSTSIRVAAPVLLDELCAELAERQEKVVTDRPKTFRRYQDALARLACALEALGAKDSMGGEADRLLADVKRLEDRIERWLAINALNDAIAEFLDAWAEQQARRKAPQLFGAQSVLAYRQARRTQWSRMRSSLALDWRPVRASRLRRRANTLLNQLGKKGKAGE